MPRGKKRKRKEISSTNDDPNKPDNHSSNPRKKRKKSRSSNRSKSSRKRKRKSKRLAKKKGIELSPTASPEPEPEPSPSQSIPIPNTTTDAVSNTNDTIPSQDIHEINTEDKDNDEIDNNVHQTEQLQCKSVKKRKRFTSKAQPSDYNTALFDESCLYSLLEVFFVGYNFTESEIEDKIRDDIWEWLWEWEQRASAFYRILITPVYEHNVFEIRVDSIHGIQSGLYCQFLLTRLTFEYYYSYSRRNIWGGWQFIHNGKCIKHDIYGNLYDELHPIQPSQIWKQVIWFKQLKMELMYKKYGGCNMSKMHLAHYFYGHHNFDHIDGNQDVYINKFPPYHNMNNGKEKRNDSNNNNNKVRKDKIDVYSYNMAQIFDNSWCRNRDIREMSIRLNQEDLSLILGTKIKMKCAQCYQTYHICRAIHLCDCFKGCFPAKDLYQRHKSMVMDWK